MAKTELQEEIEIVHDKLIAEMAERGEVHDPTTCDICIAKTEDPQGGHKVSDTFTKDQVDAQVAAATASLADRVRELEAAAVEANIEAKIAEAKAEVEAQLAEAQKQLDEAKIEQTAATERAAAAEQAVADVDAYLKQVAADAEAAEELAAKRDERVAKVKEVASFDDDYLTANADRWAGMTDEIFVATLEDYKTVAEKAGAPKSPKSDEKIPSSTGLETASKDGGKKSALSHIMELQTAGYDPRRVVQS